ncbi:hypothetical protein Sfulv_52860 [Streptomyces fulvorobeus]|uniref:Mce/MlaD domain-containing protein n=1 Tax=Streptomyces fulvorobeus TaxID=284028 RepID=A0A7J0CD72_9ACTN|nr:hypothetical protein Sfulv_52860 [Streptomyces fulvorobeus]
MSPALRRPGPRTAGAAALLAAGVAVALVVTTVDVPVFTGIDQVALPGGADLGDHPYEITAEFGDVLSLAPQSSVKVNDVAVGRVTRISLTPGSWTAKVTMRVNGTVELPGNAYAHLEQSSLLGEKFVQLSPPATGTARARSPTAAASPSPAPTGTPRWKRSSARCRCSSTAAASTSSGPSPPN